MASFFSRFDYLTESLRSRYVLQLVIARITEKSLGGLLARDIIFKKSQQANFFLTRGLKYRFERIRKTTIVLHGKLQRTMYLKKSSIVCENSPFLYIFKIDIFFVCVPTLVFTQWQIIEIHYT